MLDISVLMVSENRPEFMRFAQQQYLNMKTPFPREWVVVLSREDVPSVNQLIKKVHSLVEKADVHVIAPGHDSRTDTDIPVRQRGRHRITIDMTLPPVKSGIITLGEKRNRALELARGDLITWMDDDDLQHENRISDVFFAGSWAARQKGFVDNYHVMVRGASDLLHVKFHKLCSQSRRSHNWYEGLFVREHVKPFPTLNIGEDYHWSQQFLRPGVRCVEIGPPPSPLSINLKHYKNISEVSSMSEQEMYWKRDAPRCYVEGGEGWTGLEMLPKDL